MEDILGFACLGLLCLLVARNVEAQAVQSIQINQAIGVQKNGNLKFVAGKDTVIRALMASPVTVDPAQSTATITRDGAVVATLAPNVPGGPTAIVDFACPTRAACGSWAAGSYVFNVRVNGQSASTAGTTYRFVTRDTLRVLALAVKTNYNGTIVSVTNDSWKSLWEFTRNVYPVAADGIVWSIGPELDASSANIETNDGQYAVWDMLAKLNPAHCAANKRADVTMDPGAATAGVTRSIASEAGGLQVGAGVRVPF